MKKKSKAIKHTGRLIQTDHMGTTPSRGTEHDLHLLTTGETTHGVVRDKLGLETEVSEVGLDLATNERTKETEALSLTGVNLKDFL